MTENCISLINAGLEDKKTAQGIFIEKILYVSYHLGHVEMEKKKRCHLLYRLSCFRSRKKKNEDASSTQVSSVLETYIEPSAIALYDYEPTALDDLSFSVSSSHVFVCNIKPVFFPCNQTFFTTETSGNKVPPRS